MIKAFNSGRLYSEHGQRIAWTVLESGKVAMLDLDRHIDYIFTVDFDARIDYDYMRMVKGDSEAAHIMHAYDRADGRFPDWAEFQPVRAALREAAEKAPSLKKG